MRNIKRVTFKVLKEIKGPYENYQPSDELRTENIDFDCNAIVQGFKDYAYFKNGDIEIKQIECLFSGPRGSE